jgi:hypothetical protein
LNQKAQATSEQTTTAGSTAARSNAAGLGWLGSKRGWVCGNWSKVMDASRERRITQVTLAQAGYDDDAAACASR